ncbi:hypothetical protein BT69DRAFT_1279531, partial [Atractiella rhizophila]
MVGEEGSVLSTNCRRVLRVRVSSPESGVKPRCALTTTRPLPQAPKHLNAASFHPLCILLSSSARSQFPPRSTLQRINEPRG